MRAVILMLMVAACTSGDDDTYTPWEDEDTADPGPSPLAATDGAAPVRTQTTGACTNAFDFEKEFLIRDLSVVNDARAAAGNWSFKHMVDKLAGGDGTALAKNFLMTWRVDQKINGEVMHGNQTKVDDLIISPWGDNGFDLAKAPFRLLAIVIRPEAPGGAELRFVYGATNGIGTALPMTVAFEFGVDAAFLKNWYDTLKDETLGSASYLTKLETLTELGIATLKQVRTNEVAIDTPWDLREFHLEAGQLVPAKMAGQPKIRYNNTNFTTVTPDMETGMAVMPSADFVWKAPMMSKSQRADFAMTTCNGCHSAETGTEFTQIKPRNPTEKAQISAFLQSRECRAGDPQCTTLDNKGLFTDTQYSAKKFTVQDDRELALNAILAAANDCQP
ncbi:MAG: hypothetical protein QM831_26880 [Kofleriaceae bacterium]